MCGVCVSLDRYFVDKITRKTGWILGGCVLFSSDVHAVAQGTGFGLPRAPKNKEGMDVYVCLTGSFC